MTGRAAIVKKAAAMVVTACDDGEGRISSQSDSNDSNGNNSRQDGCNGRDGSKGSEGGDGSLPQ